MNRKPPRLALANHLFSMKTVVTICLAGLVFGIGITGCSRQAPPQLHAEVEEEALSRTEFTSRIENFFEYEPLKANRKSQFLIHLTDLTDGSPVEKADVMLSIRAKGQVAELAQIKARIGKVTGIYVADVAISQSGQYDIEFHVKNSTLDERLALTDFQVE